VRVTIIGMTMKDWDFDSNDAQAALDVSARLPSKIFDAHAHLYRQSDMPLPEGSLFATGPDVVDANAWRSILGRQVGEQRLSGGLFLPVPFAPLERINVVNVWMLDAAADCPESRVFALVAPGMRRADIETLLGREQFAGFKPYHTYSVSKPTFEAFPSDFIPEWVWEVADEHGLAITLHLVRKGAMADPDNLEYVRSHCEKYGNARLILAHAGRAFHAPNARSGALGLQGLPNLWFDTSGICEAEPLTALLESFGPRRLMWGSDFPVSEQRGRCVTAGDGFVWVTPDMTASGPSYRLLPVGVEGLRAHLRAAADTGLGSDDLQDLFCNNARRLLGLEAKTTDRTQELYRHARQRIPGGTQLLSKRPEMLAPDQWPAYFSEARGCETWDMDGRHYYDFSINGIGSCLLGFRDPEVTAAVRRRLMLGSMCTLNAPEELELADLLCELHPWAEQARFARCGGEACAVAVRIARATTDRSVVAVCGYSGWQDWYLAANLGDSDALRGHLLPGLDSLGVPRELRGTALTFTYNNREQFDDILAKHGERLAAVIMEPCRHHDPEPGFLAHVRDGAHRVGALLIFDEITIGWRLAVGGAHLKFGVKPDMAVFAKALGNGHPMAAVIGTAAAMSGAQASFISSTYWTESVGPVAALATVRKMCALDVPGHIARIGALVQEGWKASVLRHGLPVQINGYPCLAHFAFKHPQSDALRTLFTQQMLARGFLAGTGLYATLAHTEELVGRYLAAADIVFGEIAAALAAGDVMERLRGPVAHSGFKRLL
ncbi:MAG: aminotransferase class III-fold pyridoxal phosphate-dependent enzyme, partial [Kiritimatiellae bacterium]|nr:aminotransferase class III-fold pyridoxal phosphate-dependent enzyme [Kiritimatiellia bacterium]